MFTNMIRMIALMLLFCIAAQFVSAQNTKSNEELLFALQEQNAEKTSNALLNKIVELNFSKQSVENALTEIAEQLDLKLMYTEELLPVDRRISIENKRMTLYKALWEVLDGTGLQFAISPNRQLVIVKRQHSNQPPKHESLQQIISGTVFDSESGEALPGVNVIAQRSDGTNSAPIGTTTNLDGEYELEVPDDVTTLVFSYVGYQRLEEPVNGRSEINVELDQDVQLLEDIVVVGYGTQREKEITSSVTSLSIEEFNEGQMNSAAELIQGKVAGLSIARPGDNPNGDFNIRLRGLSTIGANTEPLIVIDGVPGGSLNSVDANDIASIDILKDGSAAAIYGTRGSSGVILITTKKGTTGDFQISYSGTFSANTVANTVPVMNADQFREFGGGTDFGSDTNWFDEITQTGFTQSNNLSLSGGTSQTTYRASLNFREVDGIAKKTGFSQLSGRLNLNQSAFDNRLRLNSIISLSSKESDLGFTEAFRYATIFNPTAPVTSNDSEFDQYEGYFQQVVFDMFNPVAIQKQNINESTSERYDLSLKADYDLLNELTVSGFYAREKETELIGTYYDKSSFWVGMNNNGLAGRYSNNSLNELLETTANYINTYSSLNVDLLAGYSYQDFFDEGFSAQGGDFVSDEFSYHNLATSLDFANGLGDVNSYASSHKLIAFFGRLNLNFSDTYFLSTSVRHESSSRFGENNKWGTFPAISGGVTLSNLLEMPSNTFVKIRASYGVTGNDAPESYLSMLRYGPQSGQNYLSGSNYLPSYGPVSNANPDLKWEVKKEFDIGLDFEILENGRLSGTFDYYSRVTNDLLLEFAVPVPPNLFETSWVNIGELKNNGFEAALNFKAYSGTDFSWDIGATYSSFNTELVSLSNEDLSFGNFRFLGQLGSPGLATDVIRVEEGQPLGQIWGPVYTGISDEGRWQFEDLNGDGTINDSDEKVIGNALPDFQLSLNNSFQYRNIDLNFFFRGVFGHDLVNSFRAFYENPTIITSYNILESTRDIRELNEAPKFSSYHVENASFIRLQNATIGYNFPITENFPLSRLRIYLSGQNLFTITNYKGVDPEVRFDDNGDPLGPGIDRRNTWFNSRTFSIGVNLDF